VRPGNKISRLFSSLDNMVFLAGVADAESVEVTKAQEADNPKQVTTPEAGLEKKVGEFFEEGSQLKEAPYRTDVAAPPAPRVWGLDQQTRNLSGKLEAQRENSADSKTRLDEKISSV
jgi:hypothetical protein